MTALAEHLVLREHAHDAADRGPDEDARPVADRPLRAPESAHASRAAATARTTLRSSLRASFGPTTASGSNPFTSDAIRTGKSLASNAWIQSMPLLPATAASHVDGASSPSDVTAPRPVTATRRTITAA